MQSDVKHVQISDGVCINSKISRMLLGWVVGAAVCVVGGWLVLGSNPIEMKCLIYIRIFRYHHRTHHEEDC